jgi:hypothetical protein
MGGFAVDAAVKDKPARSNLEFLGTTLFSPIFFVVTGFLIDPLALARSLSEDAMLAVGTTSALLAGKWIAAESCGRGSDMGRPHADNVVANLAPGRRDDRGKASCPAPRTWHTWPPGWSTRAAKLIMRPIDPGAHRHVPA